MDVDISLVVRVLGALLGMILLIYCMRQFLIGKKPRRFRKEKTIVVIDTIALPHQHSIWLIEVDKQRLLIANTKEFCQVMKTYEE